MSILGRIWDGIRGGRKPADTAAPAPTTTPAPSAPAAVATAPQPAAQPVDVDGILDFMNEQRDPPLNWRTSLVDLMKLTGMDSTLDERRELADELGYTGDRSDTAEMNVWLHARVLQRIREDGGQIRNLTD